jgi:hypothetical protein
LIKTNLNASLTDFNIQKSEAVNHLLEQSLQEERDKQVPPPATETVASSTDSPPSLKETVFKLHPEGSTLDSVDCSRRSDSVVVPPLMALIEENGGAQDPLDGDVPDTLIPEKDQDDPKRNDPDPKRKDPVANAMSIKCNGNTHKGDPMEDLNFPDKTPPGGESHFAGHCVETWDKSGDYIGESWGRHRRKLMGELPGICSRNALHRLHMFDQNGVLITLIPKPGG